MRRVYWVFAILLFGLTLAACAPARAEIGTEPTLVMTNVPPTESSGSGTAQLIPLATSRGDALVASSPDSVKFGAGRPVLIEFFRFT